MLVVVKKIHKAAAVELFHRALRRSGWIRSRTRREDLLQMRTHSDALAAAFPAARLKRNAPGADHCKAGTPHTDHTVGTLSVENPNSACSDNLIHVKDGMTYSVVRSQMLER